MIAYWAIIFVLIIPIQCCQLEDTELMLSYVTFRHGDRTPAQSELAFSDDLDTLETLTSSYDYGDLIELGKRRGYLIGQFLRSRYGMDISDRYNESEVYIRSTDVSRVKMTVLTAMAALYPPQGDKHRWSNYVNWDPVPYTTLPTTSDYMTAYASCPRVLYYLGKWASWASLNQTLNPKFIKYTNVFNVLSENIGFNFTTNPYLVYFVYDTYQCELSLGMTLQPWVQEIYEELEEAANVISNEAFRPFAIKQLYAGVVLNDFLKEAEEIRNGQEVTQKFRFYGSHEQNVGAMMSAVLVSQGYPNFGSVFALELRRIISTEEYVILPVYLKKPGESTFEYLQVEGCSDVYCNLTEFTNLISSYAISEEQWSVECANGEEIELY